MVAVAKKPALDFQPLRDLVLVKANPQGQTPGGIALPEGSEVEPPTGVVIRTGPDVTDLEQGDAIYMMFQSYSPPMTVPLGGVEYLLVHSNEVVGKRET